MTNDSKIHNIAGHLATVIVVASVIGGVMYLYNFFYNANKDIVAHDLRIEIEKQGTGEGAERGDTLLVNYTKMLEDGTVFDSSYRRNGGNDDPVSITLGDGLVIAGWEEGLFGMKVGEKRKLTIPPSQGYGERSIPDGKGGYLIPPNSTLIYETEVISITRH